MSAKPMLVLAAAALALTACAKKTTPPGDAGICYHVVPQKDGSLKLKQRYFHLHVPDELDEAGADGLAVDRDGRLYVATRMGLQVCDQAGRVNCIIPTPGDRVTNLCFGGPEFDTIYATCGDKVFKRKVKTKGALPFQPPIKPASPRL